MERGKNIVLILIALFVGLVFGVEFSIDDSTIIVESSLVENLREYTVEQGLSVVFFEQDDKIIGFLCIGTTDYGEYGKDIINAAMSSLVLNTVGGINEFTSAKFRYENGFDPDTHIIFEMQEYNKLQENEIQILLKSLKLSVEQISDTYGSEYVTVKTMN